ncbi:MAG TPA: GDSL-type esterase/lipase family protein [Verrucomicrobiota bacterium]|nr:GDSL-type esterase/lipase family protein [Verrucomicrobiota bacterium]HNU52732.1 GDSL-type esterase/lipase family protein [Verrucomicrobiota bacterium]
MIQAPHCPAKRAGFFLALMLILALLAEGSCAVALRIAEGKWPYSRQKNINYQLFEPHPDWVVAPRKNISAIVRGHHHHHNRDGFRGAEFSRTTPRHRIACVGGSTTYCIGVDDDDTWPHQLHRLLQPEYEVLNFGIPGHSSVEHRKLLPMVLTRYAPEIVLLQLGLNDLRNMNVTDLGPDYCNFHQPSLYAASGFTRRDRLPRSALAQAAVVLLERTKILPVYPFPHGFPAGEVSASVDPRVVEIFSANLDVMLRDCAARQVRVVLLPHTMTRSLITEGSYKWWAPYLSKAGVFNALKALNAVMQSKADGDRVTYAGFLEKETWDPSEFFDPSHLNAAGNARLARLLKDGLPWSRP